MPISPRRFILGFLVPLCLGAPSFCGHAQSAAAFEMPRVGAARALRLVDAGGRPLQGSLSEARWEERSGGLFFTRLWGGTRNIWRAFPDPQDAARYPTWRALPITQFEAPLFASGAVPIRGSRSLLVVSNASEPRGAGQIARLDLVSGLLRPITNLENGAFDAAPSPDGESVAFAATIQGATSVYGQSLSGGAVRRLVRDARHPAWQDENTLLVESLGEAAIYRVALNDAARPLKLSDGAQATAAGDGTFLCFANNGAGGDQTRLFLMAGDGSGLRPITNLSDDARRPALSPDAQMLAFDAPLPGTSSPRTLWIVPLERENLGVEPSREGSRSGSRRRVIENPQIQAPKIQAPSALPQPPAARPAPSVQITGVRSGARGAVLIYGNISGEEARATLEVGAGASPARWTAIPLIAERVANAPLAVWRPPAAAREVWTLRLTVSNSSGAARSLFALRLPLGARFPVVRATSSTPLPPGGPLPSAPLPDLPPPPRLPAPAPLPTSTPVPPTPPMPRPTPDAARRDNSQRDNATFNISGTLATMRPGQSAPVTFWALNTGSAPWAAGQRGQFTGAVRLVARWVDLDSGNRRKWVMQWLKAPVARGQRTRWSFDLVAPSQPGRYKLIYGLVRLSGENFEAPPYNAPQNSWPGEFAAIAFAVQVKP